MAWGWGKPNTTNGGTSSIISYVTCGLCHSTYSAGSFHTCSASPPNLGLCSLCGFTYLATTLHICPALNPIPTSLTAPVDLNKISLLEKVEPRKATIRVPDFVTTITAYRGWKTDRGMLFGLGYDYPWSPKKKLLAHCTESLRMVAQSPSLMNPVGIDLPQQIHAAPEITCSCGFWGFKNTELLTTALKDYQPTVVGKVALWGKIIECEYGFRAEFAYPEEIWNLNLSEDAVEELGRNYGVPIRSLNV